MTDLVVGGRLAAILRSGAFAVTGEIVPPRSGWGAGVTDHTRALVGYVDAVNVTDNPTASAHMSPVAAARFVHEAGVEPTLQLTVRDRNRLALTADVLGAWALGARNILCLSGDPIQVGDHPDAAAANDMTTEELVSLVRRLRDDGTDLSGKDVEDPPRYLIGVTEVPLAAGYDPARLEEKLGAGADFVMTQIAYDMEALAGWADLIRPRGLFERAHVIVGVTPLRSAKQARFMNDKLPGVTVPAATIAALDAAIEDAPEVGVEQAVQIVNAVRAIDGIAGVHLMGMGHDESVRRVVDGAGLFPRPVA